MKTRTGVLLTLLLLLTALVPLACAPAPPQSPRGGKLEGLTWVLKTYYANGVMKSMSTTANADAVFANGKMGGRVVNSYSAPYTATGNGDLKIGQVASTLMAGPPELMELETAYFADLAKVASYYSQGGVLTLYAADGTTLLTFGTSERSLTGSWNVIAYNNGKGALQSVMTTSPITAVFAADGTLSGTTSASQYSGPYKTRGVGGISIGPLTVTSPQGPPSVQEQSSAYLTALQAATSYTLNGSSCEMRDSAGALQVGMELATK